MDKLAEIMEWKRKEVSSRIRPVKLNELEQLGKRMKKDFSFYDSLAQDELSVIAEIKRKSPSAGDIAEDISAVEQGDRKSVV